MLDGEDLGGHHQRSLVPSIQRPRERERRHHRLAAAHVAQEQAVHRMGFFQIGVDLGEHPPLRGGEGKRQCLAQRPAHRTFFFGQGRCRGREPHGARAAHRRLLRHQFLQLETAARVFQPTFIGTGGGRVQEFQRLAQRWQVLTRAQRLVEPLGGRNHLQRPAHQTAQKPLRQSFHARIDRREAIGQGRFDRHQPRMEHLALAEEPDPDFTEPAHVLTRLQPFGGTGIDVQPAPGEQARAVVQMRDELWSRPLLALHPHDAAFHEHGRTGLRLRHGRDARLVFVAQRQEKKEILGAHHPEFHQARGYRRADARPGFQRMAERRLRRQGRITPPARRRPRPPPSPRAAALSPPPPSVPDRAR